MDEFDEPFTFTTIADEFNAMRQIIAEAQHLYVEQLVMRTLFPTPSVKQKESEEESESDEFLYPSNRCISRSP